MLVGAFAHSPTPRLELSLKGISAIGVIIIISTIATIAIGIFVVVSTITIVTIRSRFGPRHFR